MNRFLSGPRCVDCGATVLSCAADRDMEARPCCDWCEHPDPDTT